MRGEKRVGQTSLREHIFGIISVRNELLLGDVLHPERKLKYDIQVVDLAT